MSVSNQTNKIYGSGNGVTTVFSYPFKVFDVSELYAYTIAADGTVTGPLTYTTDFTATISSVTEGGTITFIVAPPTGTQWFLKRLVPYTQSATIPSEGTFPGKQFENQLDLITMMVIQANETVTRCLQFPTTYTGVIPSVPTPVAGLALGWDPDTLELVNLAVTAVGTIAVPLSNANIQPLTSASLVNGSSLYSLASTPSSAGVFPIANIATGTPTGSKFVRDDGTLQVIPTPTTLNIPYIKVTNTQSQNTAGGSTTSGSWGTIILNTKDNDTGSIATLTSNVLTLPAGTYRIAAEVPLYGGSNSINSQIKLVNTSDSTDILIGRGQLTVGSNVGIHVVKGQFILATSKNVSLQYQVSQSEATNGQGTPMNFTTEVYAILEIWKIA